MNGTENEEVKPSKTPDKRLNQNPTGSSAKNRNNKKGKDIKHGSNNAPKQANGGNPRDKKPYSHEQGWFKPGIQLGIPTLDLPMLMDQQQQQHEKKFTGRCRLFLANLPPNVTEDSLKELVSQYGEVSEVFLAPNNSYSFIKMDTRNHAEAARDALDRSTHEGRVLRVRLAAHAAAVCVKNLPPMVTNELLEYAFSYFGPVERAVVISDDRGRSIGEGLVEFARKVSAANAIKRCAQECFLLTSIPRPVVVEPLDMKDEDEGFPEKNLNRNTMEFRIEREMGPRFAEPNTFEYEFSKRWKELYEVEKDKRHQLEQEISDSRKALQEQMEYTRMEHETQRLRDQLSRMENERQRLEHLNQERKGLDTQREEERRQHELQLKQREDEILRRNQMQNLQDLRQQENDLRSQANALQHLLNQALQPNQIQQQSPSVPMAVGGHMQNGAGPMGGNINMVSQMNPNIGINHQHPQQAAAIGGGPHHQVPLPIHSPMSHPSSSPVVQDYPGQGNYYNANHGGGGYQQGYGGPPPQPGPPPYARNSYSGPIHRPGSYQNNKRRRPF